MDDEDNSVDIQVRPASGHKCARCWNFMPHVSSYGIWENVCTAASRALREMGIEPPEADSPHSDAPPAEAIQ